MLNPSIMRTPNGRPGEITKEIVDHLNKDHEYFLRAKIKIYSLVELFTNSLFEESMYKIYFRKQVFF